MAEEMDLLLVWPLIMVIEDTYVAELAPAVLKTVGEADSQTLTLNVAWASYAAQVDLCRQGRLN